jgi:hypothetical protein
LIKIEEWPIGKGEFYRFRNQDYHSDKSMQQKKCRPIKIIPFDCSIKVLRETVRHSLVSLMLAASFILLIYSIVMGDNTGSNRQPQFAEENEPKVIVKHDSQWNATVYSISRGDCTIEWIARNSEIGVIKYRSQCALFLAEQLLLLQKICDEFFSKDKNAQAFRTLYWGRLEPDNQKGSRELSLRLALAAYKSPGWDAKKGKPKNGDINGFVKDLANREMIYPELKKLFERFHKGITFSCAEKVLVLKAEKLPFYEQLKQQGVKATDKLPFDCMTWFSVSNASKK